MALTLSQKEAKARILKYLDLETRGGCFYLLGAHLSGKTYLLRNIAEEILTGENSILNLNLFLSERMLKESEYKKLAKYGAIEKFKGYIRNYIAELLKNQEDYKEIERNGRKFYLIIIDNTELLLEYDIGIVPYFDSLSVKKSFEKKIILSLPGKVADGKIYAFNKLSFSIPEFSKEFWAELSREEIL
jgi:hypothetical protein